MVKQKVCKKCGGTFPNHIYRNSRRIVLHKRKFCLNCSPFNGKNTLKLDKISEERLCISCNNILTGNQTKYCSIKCKSKNMQGKHKDRVDRHRLKAIEYLGGGCSRCGYIGNPSVYSFHHTRDKIYQISHMYSHSWESIKMELDKCVLLCGNCHMEVHDEENDFKINWQNKYRHKNKNKAVKYLGGKCKKCGYDKNLRALCFHHINKKDKEFNITSFFNRRWKLLKPELEKCELYCINCHRVLHNK